jgi:hypothetical protein
MTWADVSITVLSKLLFENMIGGKHMSAEAIKRGFPSHAKGDVEKALKRLVKDNLILHHPTSYGMQYSLNPRMLEAIRKIVEG